MTLASLIKVSLVVASSVGLWVNTALAESQNIKKTAIGIIQDGLIARNLDFINTYVAEDYIQHNPQAPDGRAGLIGFADYLASN